MSKKKVVVSGINCTLGGILAIMNDCLEQLLIYKENEDLEIIALVHSKELYKFDWIQYIEFPKSKSSWFYRLYYEYIYFRKLSKKIKPDIWISMHDISPNILCDKKYVYCHNPTPFFKPTLKDWKYDFVVSIFSLSYKFLYKINIKTNTAVIVQQNWLRDNFMKMYKINNVIVAYPTTNLGDKGLKSREIFLEKECKHFFYPSFPRSFKNFELVCKAFILLPEEIRSKVRIYLTIDETLNLYSRDLVNKYRQFSEIRFIGLLTREKVSSYYRAVDALIFPSKLETWGLPITEFKEYNKPMFLANLPYAHETLGSYDKAVFFDTNSPVELAQILEDFVKDKLEYITTRQKKIDEPFANNWKELFDYIIKE